MTVLFKHISKKLNTIKTGGFDRTKMVINLSTIIGLLIMGLFVLYGYQKGFFQNTQTLSDYIKSLGYVAPVIFILIQAIQVVIPILPGAIGCLGGVIAFGPVLGFIYSYIGICLGSLIAFLIAKKYGLSVVEKFISPKLLKKYMGYLEKNKRFDKLFTIAIFAPVAPDDALCFLAGVTSMSFKKFSLIIILGKPFAIALYSLGLYGAGNLIS